MKKLKSISCLLIIFSSFSVFGQSFNMAVNLDGIDDYAIAPNSQSLNPGDGSWSVAFWIRAANIDQVSPIVMKRLAAPPYTQYSYCFGKDDPHDPEPGKRIRINHIEDAGVTERSGYTSNEYIDGNWHHFTIVANKALDGLVIFVDGVEVEFVPLYYYGEWPDVSTTSDLIIASGSSGAKLEGPLDELSIWNKALTQDQIQEFMYDTISYEYYNSTDSGLVAYYRFDALEDLGINGGGADDFRDLSVWENHADAEGDPSLIPSLSLTSIAEKETELPFVVFPNPCTDKIHLRYQIPDTRKTKSEIIDIAGCVVKSMELQRLETTINVSDLPAGVYFIKLRTEEAVGVRKLIKK